MAAKNTLKVQYASVHNGSVFAVQRGLSATHHDAAVHEAGNGQVPSFDAVAQKVRLWIKKRSFAPRIL